jgi:hypothetical protein
LQRTPQGPSAFSTPIVVLLTSLLLVTLMRIDQQHVSALWGLTDYMYTLFTEHTVLILQL